jgi:hypothetical protein
MSPRTIFLLACFPASLALADDPTPRPTMGRITRDDPALDALLAPDAQLEVLASGLDWSEGPCWLPDRKAVVFSDVPANHVLQWKEGEGLSVFLKPSGYTGLGSYSREPGSNGLALHPSGQLAFCEHGDRRISILTTNGGKRTLADHFEGKRFNSPNDLCFDRDGHCYFTDPPYGLPGGTPMEWCLPHRSRWQSLSPHQGNDLSQRHRSQPGSENSLRRPVGWQSRPLEGFSHPPGPLARSIPPRRQCHGDGRERKIQRRMRRPQGRYRR